MTAQHSGPELYMAMELSDKVWKLAFGNGQRERLVNVSWGDQAGLWDAVSRSKQRFGLPESASVKSCYEAGRDGFWIHHLLLQAGIENVVVDPASIEVSRHARRAKTDRLDAKKLLSMLRRYWVHGEKKVWRVCMVPSEAAEDERRLHRELDRLKTERTGHRNRIGSLLVTRGVKISSPHSCDLSELRDWAGKGLAGGLLAELQREQHRLQMVQEQIREINQEKKRRLTDPVTEADRTAQKLLRLRAVGPVTSWLLSKEFFAWRSFRNRRQVGAAAGLTGTPYNSGDGCREQGISKAGSKWVRHTCVELAWNWLRFQPDSALSQWYQRRFGGGGKRMRRIGIVALARKLLIALWKYVEHGEVPEGATFKTEFYW